MADNDQNNDEYKFSELDAVDNDPMGNSGDGFNPDSRGEGQLSDRKNIKRNALIAIGLVVFAMVMYKLVGSFFPKSNNQAKNAIVPVKTASAPAVTQLPASPPPSTVKVAEPAPQQVVAAVDTELKQKVSAIEVSEQTIRAEVTSVGEQVVSVNNNINNLNTQLNNLNQVITTLSTQVAKQSEELNLLRACTQPKKVKQKTHIQVERVIFYLKAVIPGRAWLIGSNGSTLTVREGTKIAGYGTVKLIDSMQGRVLTSSGQIIRFSQEDS